jgi:hypothetical protein
MPLSIILAAGGSHALKIGRTTFFAIIFVGSMIDNQLISIPSIHMFVFMKDMLSTGRKLNANRTRRG